MRTWHLDSSLDATTSPHIRCPSTRGTSRSPFGSAPTSACSSSSSAHLLLDAADPHRGWTALVIAEPQRAFSGGQFQLVLPTLTHYGVELWVPELGGRVDPDSEGRGAHGTLRRAGEGGAAPPADPDAQRDARMRSAEFLPLSGSQRSFFRIGGRDEGHPDPVIRAVVDAARYRHAMRRALRATRAAVDRGGRNKTRGYLCDHTGTRERAGQRGSWSVAASGHISPPPP